MLTKHGEAFRDRIITEECAIKTALAFGDKEQAENIKKVSFSRQTVGRRVAELSDNMILQLKENVQKCKYFLWP